MHWKEWVEPTELSRASKQALRAPSGMFNKAEAACKPLSCERGWRWRGRPPWLTGRSVFARRRSSSCSTPLCTRCTAPTCVSQQWWPRRGPGGETGGVKLETVVTHDVTRSTCVLLANEFLHKRIRFARPEQTDRRMSRRVLALQSTASSSRVTSLHRWKTQEINHRSFIGNRFHATLRIVSPYICKKC